MISAASGFCPANSFKTEATIATSPIAEKRNTRILFGVDMVYVMLGVFLWA